MTLHDRIRAVVEERLQIAREAQAKVGHGEWRYATSPERHTTWHCVRAGNDVMVCDDALAETVAGHIAANDPADAILSAEHALGILERHEPFYGDEYRYGVVCKAHHPAAWPCAEIEALARRWRVEVDG